MRTAPQHQPTVSALDVEQLLRRVRSSCRRILAELEIPRSDGEDLIQETLVTLLFKWEQVRNPEAWLLATLRNRCKSYWAHRETEPCESLDEQDSQLSCTPPPQLASELRHDLNSVASQLPREQRDLLYLKYGLGFKSSEMAETLGVESEDLRYLTTSSLNSLGHALRDSGFGPSRR